MIECPNALPGARPGGQPTQSAVAVVGHQPNAQPVEPDDQPTEPDVMAVGAHQPDAQSDIDAMSDDDQPPAPPGPLHWDEVQPEGIMDCHHSHKMKQYRTVVFCSMCGAYSQYWLYWEEKYRTSPKLRGPCMSMATKKGHAVLSKLRKGKCPATSGWAPLK